MTVNAEQQDHCPTRPAHGPGTRSTATCSLGVAGAMMAASSAAIAIPSATELPADADIGHRIAVIRQQLSDPATATKLADKLKIRREGGLVQFANFNNWDNGWNNQGFANY